MLRKFLSLLCLPPLSRQSPPPMRTIPTTACHAKCEGNSTFGPAVTTKAGMFPASRSGGDALAGEKESQSLNPV
jgi:hypothetical protein